MANFSLANFITRTLGKKIGTGQCVAYMRRYLQERFGDDHYGIPGVQGAEDIWDVVDTRKWSKHGRASGFIPQRNALLIMRGHAGNENGHVAIVRDGSTGSRIYTVDQNWSHPLHVAKEMHPLNSAIIGYLVAK